MLQHAVTGSGTLFSVTFTGIANGVTPAHLQHLDGERHGADSERLPAQRGESDLRTDERTAHRSVQTQPTNTASAHADRQRYPHGDRNRARATATATNTGLPISTGTATNTDRAGDGHHARRAAARPRSPTRRPPVRRRRIEHATPSNTATVTQTPSMTASRHRLPTPGTNATDHAAVRSLARDRNRSSHRLPAVRRFTGQAHLVGRNAADSPSGRIRPVTACRVARRSPSPATPATVIASARRSPPTRPARFWVRGPAVRSRSTVVAACGRACRLHIPNSAGAASGHAGAAPI